jgi:hypothetical protein
VAARLDAFGEGAECYVAGHALPPLAGHVAAADVHGDRGRVPGEAALDDPVRHRGPGLLTAPPLLLPPLGRGDLLPYPVEGELQPRLQGAEPGQVGREIGHEFDCIGVVREPSGVEPAVRYHVILSIEGRRALDGWWGDEPTARRKFRQLVGQQGRDGVTVTLVDEEQGAVLTSWSADA